MDPSELVKEVKALTRRNKELEEALSAVHNALKGSHQEQQPPRATVAELVPYDPTSKVKLPHNRLRIQGISYYGKRGKYTVYQCDRCKQIGHPRTIKKHTECRAKLEEKKKKKLRRKEKAVTGFTLEPSKKGGDLFYSCDHCHTKVLETTVRNHICKKERRAPIIADICLDNEALIFTEEEEEEEEEEPLYRGYIPGWHWHSINNGYSMYQCDDCHIAMRHDYIYKHQCRANRSLHDHPNDDMFSIVL